MLTSAQQALRLLDQQPKSKHKLYSHHEPDIDCISKGRAHKRYEFGVKASIATILKEGFIVGAGVIRVILTMDIPYAISSSK